MQINLNDTIEKEIVRAVDAAVQKHIVDTIDQLILDESWLTKIEGLVNSTFSQKIERKLNTIDFESVIVEQIDSGIERWQQRLVENFRTTGIVDDSQFPNLKVTNGGIETYGDVKAEGISVSENGSVGGVLTVNDLVVKKSINTDNKSWQELKDTVVNQTLESVNAEWKQQLVDSVVAQAAKEGIEFGEVLLNGESLVKDQALNPYITKSGLQTVGELRSLAVRGEAEFNNTAYVLNKRVGINTTSPDRALTIWDEEVSISIGKNSADTAYIGTNRDQALTLGVNRKSVVKIDNEGRLTTQKLRVDRWEIGTTGDTPGFKGTRGDILFNNNPKENTPFAWVCLGGFKWKELRV